MPWMIPPSTWLDAPSGLITRPMSWIAAIRSTVTSPVSTSTATSATCMPNVSTSMPGRVRAARARAEDLAVAEQADAPRASGQLSPPAATTIPPASVSCEASTS